jgi:hypothetical protein
MNFVVGSRTWLVMCDGKTDAQGIRPRPETLTESCTNRVNKVRVGMMFEEGLKDINVYWHANLE